MQDIIYEPNYLVLCPDKYYFFICNSIDKKLNGKRNDSLINIICSNNLLVDPYKDGIYVLGDIYKHDNIFFCYTMKKGGKCTLEENNNRFIFLRECIQKIKNVISESPCNLICDYSNMFIDSETPEHYIKQYKTFFKEIPDIFIGIHINTKIMNNKIKNIFISKKKLDLPKPDLIAKKIDITKIKFFTEVIYKEEDII